MEKQFPKNVRQIGNVCDSPKIYVEDYVLEEVIIQTRSIMYWHFQESSAVHLMFTQRKLTMR